MWSLFTPVYLEDKSINVFPDGASKLHQCVSDLQLISLWLVTESLPQAWSHCELPSPINDEDWTTTFRIASEHKQGEIIKGEECQKPWFSSNQCNLPVKKRHLFLWSLLLKAISTQWANDGSYSPCAKADCQQGYVKQPGLLLFWYVVDHMVTPYIEISEGEINHR